MSRREEILTELNTNDLNGARSARAIALALASGKSVPQEDIDRLDSRLKRGTKRFADYAARQSGCCIVIILILELIAGILFVTLI